MAGTKHKHSKRGRGDRREAARSVIPLRILQDTPPWDWPGDAGQVIRATLADPHASPPDRLIAADLAGNPIVVDDDMADLLLGILSDAAQPEELRATAASSFGPALEHAFTFEFDDPEDILFSEAKADQIRMALHRLYLNETIPRLVRRRILEPSIRSPDDWHSDAVSRAYSSGDRDWILTAVFCMQSVRGFDDQILEALESGDPEIQLEAVEAAGNWSVDPAWDHVVALVRGADTPKPLLLAAIRAVENIRPQETEEILFEVSNSDDEEIAEAADEAIMMASTGEDTDESDEDDENEWF